VAQTRNQQQTFTAPPEASALLRSVEPKLHRLYGTAQQV
jgi:hypothetical protein